MPLPRFLQAFTDSFGETEVPANRLAPGSNLEKPAAASFRKHAAANGVMRLKTAVDAAFIRHALEIADLNAVRIALYQQTQDPWLEALPVAAKCDAADTAILIDKAAAWLLENAGGAAPPEPPEPQLRKLMNMATGEDMDDVEFEARRDLPAFGPFPFFAQWQGEKPPLPEGFKLAIIGSGFAGIAAAVQCELLGLPYVVLERQPEPGGTWTINRYPDVRVDTPSIIYEYSFEKSYRWTEHFGRGGEVQSYLAYIAKKYGVAENTRYSTDLQRASFDESRQLGALRLPPLTGRRRWKQMPSSRLPVSSPTPSCRIFPARKVSREYWCILHAGHRGSICAASGWRFWAMALPAYKSWGPSQARPKRFMCFSAPRNGSVLAPIMASHWSRNSPGWLKIFRVIGTGGAIWRRRRCSRSMIIKCPIRPGRPVAA